MKNNIEVGAIDNIINQYIQQYGIVPEEIDYALNGGGKRVRPMLLLDTAMSIGNVDDCVYRMAVALECVHTYSLIHDDLPSMDNDDIRRGRPTVHKQFGEARAVLAGDGLLNLSMEILSDAQHCSEGYFKAMRYLYKCSGVKGMIKGQLLDIAQNVHTVSDVDCVALNKTGRLLQAALVMPLLYFGKDSYVQQAEEVADLLGRAYQLADDLLDESKTDETSYLKVMSEQQAKDLLISITALLRRKTSDLRQSLGGGLNYFDALVQFNALRKG